MLLSISKTSEWRTEISMILNSCLEKAPWHWTPVLRKLSDKCRKHTKISTFPKGKCCNWSSTRLLGRRKSMQGSHRKPLCVTSAAHGITHLNSSSAPAGRVELANSTSLYSQCRCYFQTSSFPSSPSQPLGPAWKSCSGCSSYECSSWSESKWGLVSWFRLG